MSLRKGDTGALVEQLQRDLVELGFALPRYGIDGDMRGDETLGAFELFLRAHGQAVTDGRYDVVSDAELALITQVASAHRAARAAAGDDPLLVDRRGPAGVAGRHHDYGMRPWADVWGWCLHQTACDLEASRDIARCDAIGAHWVVYRDGRKFKLHDANRRIVHGNGWNTRTIGIEINGRFEGVKGRADTLWDDPTTPWRETPTLLTDAQVASVMAIIRADRAEIRAHGGRERVLVVHRQASGDRRNDPGSEVWQRIGIPMRDELGLDDGGYGFKLEDGYGGMPIPGDWDPSREGIKY